jgi:hypothetical protein
MSIPECNNVYGQLRCPLNLEDVADLLRYRIGLSPQQIWVIRSQFDGVQKLRIETDVAEFETTKKNEEDLYFFNGAVGGNPDEVSEYVKTLHKILLQGGYQSSFEVYDRDFNCIQEIKA